MLFLYGFIFIIVNNLILKLYCTVQEKLENKHVNVIKQTGENDSGEHSVKMLKQRINAYAYGWMRFCIIITGRIPSYKIRSFLYKYVFNMKISRKTVIFACCEFRSPWNIQLGNCIIGPNSLLDGRAGIIIEDNCVLGNGVHIWTREHSVNDPFFRVLKENNLPVHIKNYAWVCSDTSILPGVEIGEGSVLASRACAVNNTEPFTVYGGVPAKPISKRNVDLRYELEGKPTWHFY